MAKKDEERRKNQRIVSYKKLFLNVLSCPANEERTGETFTCTSIDVSSDGVRLLLEKAVPQDSSVEIWVKPVDPPDPLALRANVVWCKQAEDTGFYWVGIALTHENQEDLDVWKSLFAPEQPAEA